MNGLCYTPFRGTLHKTVKEKSDPILNVFENCFKI